jgi:hypothetical protein
MDPVWVAIGAGAAITLSVGVKVYLDRRKTKNVSGSAKGDRAYNVTQTDIRTGGGDNAGRDINKSNKG